ncbi:UDP-3-O-acylglucosamine N-acyltransferase [Marinobacter litoralis]|uniref:UDP-3-O-acylglucosamine N-acyltransferase n=1 Tax=Marinobacter litoralis TaxID=187981 RepID=A0A3M2RFC6_9GAMM|nr:UDP-3-O-(3-hydroxymyristoyl)glucosamine N-acyltransferase [Marinobacter litoralis]RMJ03869.1 UDP-3-O-acylglucosamine N-acyltransferase [Marinobacter litoralis]
MAETSYRLQEIADALGASLRGDPDARVSGMATLQAAGPSQISFLANPSYGKYLKDSRAGAVIVSPATADQAQTNVLILDNPYMGYARLSHWFDRTPVASAGIHPSAVVDPSATISSTASIGPHVVIETEVVIGEQVVVGAGSVVGARSRVGDCTVLSPRVTLAHDVQLGQRCSILSGAVIGGAGFGFANEKGEWHRIAQLGGVILGDDVEVGANTTIDRGALGPTVIGNGVKLDNLIQIAHNVQIGDHTAMAALSAIAGSTSIGKYCVFGGASAVAGHLNIADQVHLTGMSMVTNDISEPGVYSSGLPADKNRQWRKNAVRFRQLDGLARRIKELEKKFKG